MAAHIRKIQICAARHVSK